jgi:hypothetical protein
METARATLVECASQHDAEVISIGKLPPSASTTMPDQATASTVTMPICRNQLARYLGGPEADATNLVAMPLWPNDQEWAKGERWLLCTVAEVGPDERPKQRTGALRGTFQTDGMLRHQTCSAGSPSRDPRILRSPCDSPHLGEALPGVISAGKPADPMPSTETINSLAQQRCPAVLATYIGARNPEVLPAWRIPNAESWARGYTNIVCYAEPIRPVKVRLRNLAQAKLPD